MAYTLMLNDKWDIFADKAGNISTTQDDYAIAQNVANAERLFQNDAYFEQSKGIPYISSVFNDRPTVGQSVLINRWRQAALNVEGVTDCEPIPVYDQEDQIIGGRIVATTVNGTQVQVEV